MPFVYDTVTGPLLEYISCDMLFIFKVLFALKSMHCFFNYDIKLSTVGYQAFFNQKYYWFPCSHPEIHFLSLFVSLHASSQLVFNI